MSDGHSRAKFSIRQLMIAMFFLALCSLVAAAGNAGDPVAYGLVLGAAGLMVSIGCMALFRCSLFARRFKISLAILDARMLCVVVLDVVVVVVVVVIPLSSESSSSFSSTSSSPSKRSRADVDAKAAFRANRSKSSSRSLVNA